MTVSALDMPRQQPKLASFFELVAVEETDSTNEEAKRRARAGAREGTLIWSEKQSGGKGRQGRSWVSPPGNLYMSVILKPNRPPAEAAQLSFVSALAVGEALMALASDHTRLSYKWPNDVLLEGRKVSGILLESDGGVDGHLAWLVLGIGVNVASSPRNLSFEATDLAACGADVSAADVLSAVSEAFLTALQRWQTEGFGPIRERWLSRAANLGEMIEVHLPAETIQGRFEGLDDSGALLLGGADQSVRRISAGDVYFPATTERA